MNAVNAALAAALKADVELLALGVAGVYKGLAPQGSTASPVPFPYIIYQKQAGTPQHGLGGVLVRRLVYLVKVVDKGNSSVRAGNIDARIEELLEENPLVAVDHQLYFVHRSSDVDYSEVSEGVTYQHVGGFYRLAVNKR